MIFISNRSDQFRILVWYNPCYGKYSVLGLWTWTFFSGKLLFDASFSPRTDQDFHLK